MDNLVYCLTILISTHPQSTVCGEVSELLFYAEFFVILLAMFLPIKTPFDSAIFKIILFDVVLSVASATNFLSWSRSF